MKFTVFSTTAIMSVLSLNDIMLYLTSHIFFKFYNVLGISLKRTHQTSWKTKGEKIQSSSGAKAYPINDGDCISKTLR